MNRVAIVFTGGTISMEPDAEAGGNRPVLNGAAILARSPEVASIADVEAIDWGLIPASHLRFEQVLDIARTVDRQLSRPEIAGVVVVQGTDTIEETAFAFDLLLHTDKPVVVTGAMRDAASAEYDGPRNLADAVACAVSAELVGAGVLVVLAGVIVAADDAVKGHTTALDAFRARDGHPLGHVREGVPVISRRRAGRWTLPEMPSSSVEDVYLVTAVTGMDGSLVRSLASLRPRGLVVAATGTGNTHPDLLAAAGELMDAGTIVALTTRCPAGNVDPIYAFPGGGATWQRAGAILSRFDGPKTRVALALGLAAGLDHAALTDLMGLALARVS